MTPVNREIARTILKKHMDSDNPLGKMPWPLTLDELQHFETAGLRIVEFEDYWDQEDPPVRRFRVTYCRE